MGSLVIRQVSKNCANLWSKMGPVINSILHSNSTLCNGPSWINTGNMFTLRVHISTEIKRSFTTEENECRFRITVMHLMTVPVHKTQS